MVKTAHFHCRVHGFDPWLGNHDHPTSQVARPKKRRRRGKRNEDTDVPQVCELREVGVVGRG